MTWPPDTHQDVEDAVTDAVQCVVYSGSLATARPSPANVVIWQGFPSEPDNFEPEDLRVTGELVALPRQAFIAGFHYPSASSTTPTISVQASAAIGAYANAGLSVNNYMEWEVLLDAGTYVVWLSWVKSTNAGVITTSVDGADLATTVDSYGTFVAINGTQLSTTLALTAGRHLVRTRVASKNGSSSNYSQGITGIYLSRTGA